MLGLERVSAGYGRAQVLRDVSLSVGAGEILCLFGLNGAGKTTTLRAVMGLVPLWSGSVTVDGARIDTLPAHKVPGAGVGYVPQGRRLFKDLTVRENLDVALMVARGDKRAVLDHALALFPRLTERMGQRADTLSGGEQQMLATARALCVGPRVLLMDEPTEGLQPSMIDAIRQVVVALRDEGAAILLVEQRLEAVLSVADRVAFMERGRIAATHPAADLARDRALADRYLDL